MLAEKSTMVAQLAAWFEEYGVPVAALRGYGSQTLLDDLAADIHEDGRAAVVLYAGDWDPSGEDIERDARARLRGDHRWVRVALSAEQVQEHRLPPVPGKDTDPRAPGFRARHGALVQVEIEALEPDVLRDLYLSAFEPYWDLSRFERALAREREDRAALLRPV